MATIVTRSGKGTPLTNAEVDANFTNLNADKLESGDTVASLTLTSADINGGTIDGTVIGASSPAAITGTTITGTSATINGDITISDKIIHSGDTNTAIRFPAADTVTVETGGAERLRVTSAGDVGIGGSPTAFGGGFVVSQVTGSSGGYSLQASGSVMTQVAADSTASVGYTGTRSNHPHVFTTNNTERMRIDSSGNLGLGVTPSAWGGASKAFQVGLGGSVNGSTASTIVGIASNQYYDGSSDRYITTNPASAYTQFQGVHRWFTAPSGTAGNPISFTQAMTLDASGRLGIGTTSPAERLNVVGGYANFAGLRIAGTDQDASNNIYLASGYLSLSTGSAAGIVFKTNLTERARIDASGNLLVGTTTLPTTGSTGTRIGNYYIYLAEAGTGFSTRMAFINSNGIVGSIATNGSSTSYATSSDYRLKENVAPMQNALDTVAQLNPVTYTWKADGSAGQGFIAHELQAVVPDCVTGEKDAVDETGNPQYQGVDTSFLVATLVKAIQELTARVAELENRNP